MTTIFKKTLLATAVLAFAGAANAAVVKQYVATPHSAQGIGASVAAGTVHVLLKAEYAVGDTITIKFPGAAFHSTSAPTIAGLSAAAGKTAADALTDPAGNITAVDLSGAGAIVFGLLSASGDTLTFRVTEKGAASTVNGVLALSNVVFTGASVSAAKDLGIAFSAATSTGLAIDVATTNNGKLIAVKDQFELEVGTKADAVIDVAADRKLFSTTTPASHDAREDELAFTTTSNAYTGAVTASKVTYTIAGDFSWVDQDANGTVTTTELNTAISGLTVAADALKIADDRQSITFEKAAVGTVSPTFVISAASPATSKVVLNASDYTVSAKVDYPTDKSSSYTAAAGGWKLNGSVVNVPYLVLQDGRFSSIVNVTNTGVKSGAITVDVRNEAGKTIASGYPAGTSAPGSVVGVAGALRNALVASGADLTKATKFSATVVTNVPANDVTVYSAYADAQNGGERAIVNNDSKVQTK